MGCDIHLYVEMKQDGVWKPYDGEWANPDYNPESESEWERKARPVLSQSMPTYRQDEEPLVWDRELEDEVPWSNKYPDIAYVGETFYSGRNYDLFSILADVRNGYGFAGIPTGSKIKPIAEPRGLPDNVSPEIQLQSDLWNGDGHSHSWLSLQELLDYDWEGQKKTHTGIVGIEDYRAFKSGDPDFLVSGSIWAGNLVEVDNEAMDKILADGIPEDVTKLYEDDEKYSGPLVVTRIYWNEPLSYSAGYFYNKHLPLLKQFAEREDVEDIRIVFWFDN